MVLTRRNYNQNWFPTLFNDLFNDEALVRRNSASPATNIIEDEKGYKIEIAAPGMTKQDFNIQLNPNNELVISMEKKTENNEGENEAEKETQKYIRHEFSYTKFEQTLILPDDVESDEIKANVTDGVLTVELPKRTPEQEAKANRIIEIQ